MKTKDRPLNLARTKAALQAYDAFDAQFDAHGTQEEVLAEFAKLETLAQAVGYAFGLDTADRNSLETCRQVIRPGQKEPGHGCEQSFVRRAVKKWEETSCTRCGEDPVACDCDGGPNA